MRSLQTLEKEALTSALSQRQDPAAGLKERQRKVSSSPGTQQPSRKEDEGKSHRG